MEKTDSVHFALLASFVHLLLNLSTVRLGAQAVLDAPI